MPSISETPTTTAKPAIVINDISKAFTIRHATSVKEAVVSLIRRQKVSTKFQAIDHLSFDVPEGQSVALMGRNGSGKSTTLKMLSGVLRPDSGWIRTRGRIAGLLEVGAGFNPNLTGRDNVYLNAAILGMSKDETEAVFDDIVEFAEIGDFIDTEVKFYSSGMYSRLGFAVAVHTQLDVLLVDEVLSVGDAAFRKKCIARMTELRAAGKTMFIVSHSSSQVKQLCDRGIVLHQGKIVFDGPIEDAIKEMNAKSGAVDRRLHQASKRAFVPSDALARYIKKHPESYGEPLGAPIEITENGGGLLQQCTKGIIVSSRELQVTQGLRNGAFQRAYDAAGGPRGDWGFVMGKVQILDQGGRRSLRFQSGVAKYSPGSGDVTFTHD
ncbi:ATP-binding cassette domain-containing protein [Leucobacter sp. NPDC058333]|uniref:ATP-binding cassette domain-containing protein n=1 Tax=Leucobacter sp. NPDC058333 TaxID=3346450 RepID=UPI00366974F3